MIKKFNDYDSIQLFDGESLEVGGYELKIIGAKVENYDRCSVLKVAIEIENHEKYAGFYGRRFQVAKSKNPDAKWNGVFDVFIPKDDGTETDGYTKQAFKRFITSVEESNQGYFWNWEESSLVGKKFGGIFGREQFETKEGELKFAVKCRYPRSLDAIRKGKFEIPKDKLLKAKGNTSTPQQNNSVLSDFEAILGDGDMPF